MVQKKKKGRLCACVVIIEKGKVAKWEELMNLDEGQEFIVLNLHLCLMAKHFSK